MYFQQYLGEHIGTVLEHGTYGSRQFFKTFRYKNQEIKAESWMSSVYQEDQNESTTLAHKVNVIPEARQWHGTRHRFHQL